MFSSHQEKRIAMLKCSEMILKGDSVKDMVQQLQDDIGFNESQAIKFINDTRDVIAQATAENNEKIIEIHTLLYEDIYNRFEKLGNASGKMKAMAQKEKLLNLYQDESTEVVMNTQNNININTTNYDVSKLDQNQQNRLQELLSKAQNKQ